MRLSMAQLGEPVTLAQLTAAQGKDVQWPWGGERHWILRHVLGRQCALNRTFDLEAQQAEASIGTPKALRTHRSGKLRGGDHTISPFKDHATAL